LEQNISGLITWCCLRASLRLGMLALLVLGSIAAACHAEPQMTSLDSTLANSPKDFWKAFMPMFYGHYDKGKKCWINTNSSGTFCMRPHTFEEIATSDGGRIYATVAGGITGAPDNNDCHACNGNIGYFVLATGTDVLALIAKSELYEPGGVYGRVPDETKFQIVRLGPNQNYGWFTEVWDAGQGITVRNTQIHGVIGENVLDLGYVPLSFDNNGDCENGKLTNSDEKCSDYFFAVAPATELPGQFSPIHMRSSGLLKGAMFEKPFTVQFDDKNRRYILPQDLPEDVRN
jgi:hypothetical protein